MYEYDQDFIGNCIVYSLFTKNFTDWQLFLNSEIGLSGADRDISVYNLLTKDRKFSKEAQDVLKFAKQAYTKYHELYKFTKLNANWQDVSKELKHNNDFYDLKTSFNQSIQSLSHRISQDIYKYGFLK